MIDNYKNVSSIDNKKISRQEIFNQIDEDLLSQQRSFSIEQNTKSNYFFILMIDLIAFLFAVLGCLYLYDVLKEQQIRLVSGQNGVQILENTLLEQINKKYQQELEQKTLELEKLSLHLEDITKKYQATLAEIEANAKKAIEEEKRKLQLEMENNFQGKNIQDQDQIREQYNIKIQQIVDQINAVKVKQTEQEQNNYQQQYQQQEQLQLEIQKIKEKSIESQSALKAQPIDIVPNNIHNELLEYQKSDIYIANKFKDIEIPLLNKEYDQVSNILLQIENFYKTNHNKYLLNRKISDLYFVASITNYVKLYNELEKLHSTNILIKNNIQAFHQEFNKTKHDKKTLIKYIDNIKNMIPELLEFSQSYVSFLALDKSDMKNVNINYINILVKDQKYTQAIQEYKKILLDNQLSKRSKENIINKFAETIELQLSSTVYSNNKENKKIDEIPKTLASKVQKILTNDRYNILDSKIVYMVAPDGYILDNLQDDQVIIKLKQGKKLVNKQILNVYRITSDKNFTMDKIGQLQVINSKRKIARKYLFKNELKIGDLIYIEKSK